MPALLALFLFLSLTAASPLRPRQTSSGPSFVTEYAPILHLFSTDPYRPSDISTHLANTRPFLNGTALTTSSSPLTIQDLNDLNSTPNSNNGRDIFLNSVSDFTTTPRPSYLYGTTPNAQGRTENAITSVIVSVPKANNIVDVFYFYFYSFDYGGDYPIPLLGTRNIGNHVGDWEHNTIRFVNGVPQSIWYSQHAGGQAFKYGATEKANGKRPKVFVANGTHANYAVKGTHDHTIPNINLPFQVLVTDYTDEGPVWDPTLSAYYYSYDVASKTFTGYDGAPTGFLQFLGKWGDDRLAEDDSRQDCLFGIDALCKYVGGPTGPVDKGLDRKEVCPDDEKCFVSPVLLARSES